MKNTRSLLTFVKIYRGVVDAHFWQRPTGTKKRQKAPGIFISCLLFYA